MFIPLRKTGLLFKKTGTNGYGEQTFESEGKKFGWAPVRVQSSVEDSPVRADSSASKARAEHKAISGRYVVDKKISPSIGDRVSIDGVISEVYRVQERMSVNGKLHHWEIDVVAP